MSRTIRQGAALLICLVAIAAGVAAQDGLYAPVRPGDTALVRIIHVGWGGSASGSAGGPGGAPRAVTIDVGTTRFSDVPAESGTAYRPVRPGVYVIMAYGRREALTATVGSFHTVVVSPGAISIFRDTWHDDPLRAQIVLYNMASAPARLDAVSPQAPLLDSVAAGTSGTRVVNAIAVTLAVSWAVDATSATSGSGDEAAGAWQASLTLSRGASYGLVVGEDAGGLAGFVIQAEVESRSQE